MNLDFNYKFFLFANMRILREFQLIIGFDNCKNERDLRLLKFLKYFPIKLPLLFFFYKMKSKYSNIFLLSIARSKSWSKFKKLNRLFFSYIASDYWAQTDSLFYSIYPLYSFFNRYLNIDSILFFSFSFFLGNFVNYSKLINCWWKSLF